MGATGARGPGWGYAIALALTLTLSPACGGKDKGAGTTPATAGGSAAQNPEEIDPQVAGDVPTTTFGGKAGSGQQGGAGAGAGGAAGQPAEGDGGGTAPGTPSGPPIKPPGLDLSPQQKAAKIRSNLEKARAAMSKPAPDAETGIAEAKAALAVDEKNLPAMLFLAHGNFVKGNHDKAEYTLNRAEKIPGGQRSAKLYFLFGLVYEATNREDEAESAYKKAVSLSPNYRPALLNLGVYHIKNKRYEEARALYERLTGPLGSKSPAAWTNLGSAYRGLTGRGGLDEATRASLLRRSEEALRRALELDQSYANAYYNLGVLYLDADPWPTPKGDVDTLKRLGTARQYFDLYSRRPGADKRLAEEQMAVAQKLIDREKRIRERRRKREERRRKREAQKESG